MLCNNSFLQGDSFLNSEIYDQVRLMPKYKKLVRTRRNFALMLAGVVFFIYFTFILIIAFSPKTLGITLGSGVTTIGIPMGICIILMCFILTGVYIKKANNEFDSLVNEIKEELTY